MTKRVNYCILALGKAQKWRATVMKTLTDTTINPHSLQMNVETYEIIENELLEGSNFKELAISGSLFSLTTFKNVTFDSCAFFATRMENCEFINCKFVNCTFQFCSMTHCEFHFAKIDRCTWEFSPLKNNLLSQSWLGTKMLRALEKEDSNEIQNCFSIEGWSLELLGQEDKAA